MPMIKTAQGPLFCAQRGTAAPALVCLHGAGGTHQHWGLQLRGLRDLVRVVLPDLPGHGRSAPPGRDSIAAYSDVLLALLDSLELEQAVVAGHSMGGAIAIWTALLAPQRISGLVLTATGARLPVAPAILKGLQHTPEAAVQMIVDDVYDEGVALDLKLAGEMGFTQADPQVFHADLQACDVFDVRAMVGGIACPTLVLCGSSDRMLPPKFSTYLHEHINGSELVQIERAGHMVMIEQAEAVNAAIRRWLTSHYRSG